MREHFIGCLLGLALGDALGAKREGGAAARGMWWLLGVMRPGVLRWTDDTQMALGLAQSLAKHGRVDADALAKAWAHEARWRRGYGRGALRTLKRIRGGMRWEQAAVSVFKDGSYGNGAAMRVAPLGLFFEDPAERRDAAQLSARITHAHPLGIEGAVLIAEATYLALRGGVTVAHLQGVCAEVQILDRLAKLDALLNSNRSPRDIATELGNSIRAHESVVTAVYAYLRFRERPFLEMVEFVLAMGGDTDTIAAMAGALYGAEHGEAGLPSAPLQRLEAIDTLRQAAADLHARARG